MVRREGGHAVLVRVWFRVILSMGSHHSLLSVSRLVVLCVLHGRRGRLPLRYIRGRKHIRQRLVVCSQTCDGRHSHCQRECGIAQCARFLVPISLSLHPLTFLDELTQQPRITFFFPLFLISTVVCVCAWCSLVFRGTYNMLYFNS